VTPPLPNKIIFPFQTEFLQCNTDGTLNIAMQMPGILKLQKLNSDLHSAQTFNINVLHFYGNIYRSIFVPQYIPFPEPTFLAKLHSSLPSKWHRFSGGKILTRDPS